MSDTREKILDVAEEFVQTVGLNAMSYKHISDAVGIRKASIHHHFPKKENLVDELLSRCNTSYGDDYRRIVEGEGSAPEKLRRIAAVFEASASDFVGLPYADPPGGVRTCLNSKLARCQATVERPGRPPRTLHSAHRAALEIIPTRDDHGVAVLELPTPS